MWTKASYTPVYTISVSKYISQKPISTLNSAFSVEIMAKGFDVDIIQSF